MKVLVKRDSSTNTPVDLGEGEEAQAKLSTLVRQHGHANVTNEDGTPVEVKTAKPLTRAQAAKAAAKAKADAAKAAAKTKAEAKAAAKAAKKGK